MSRRFVETTLACCVCGARAATFWRRAGDHLLGGPRCFQAVRCARCGTARLDPRPSPEEMERHYRPTTYARAADDGSGLAERLDVTNRETALRAAAAVAASCPRRVLDVGCGDGRFLAAMAALGWSGEGVETDPAAADLARARSGCPIHVGDLSSVDLPERTYGLVALVHVIEHVPDPHELLVRVRRLLAPGGIVHIVAPNAGSLEAALFRSCWYPLDLPRHFWGFTPHTLARLLETSGFESPTIRHFPFVNSLQSLRYAARALGGKPIGEERDVDQAAAEAPGSVKSRLFRLVNAISVRAGKLLPGEVMELSAVVRPEVGR
ncbi:MAG: class I SAM-dependent methyltransferase [Armatimonadota bacterium]